MAYRGYYIDNVIFHSKKEIDEFIKAKLIKKLQMLGKMFVETHDPEGGMAISILMSEVGQTLHDTCGMTWSEIEEVEFA